MTYFYNGFFFVVVSQYLLAKPKVSLPLYYATDTKTFQVHNWAGFKQFKKEN